ncbi:MAG: hypothetical protein RIR65_1415 [Planctomycetota bacterium]|jgi:arylsulfatase A-like enzyme
MDARRHLPLLLLCLAGLMLACGPKPSGVGTGRGILVIAIDGLRADHLGVGGNDRPATPVLDGLARQGAWFADARAATPDLEGAHAALLTGCDPRLARRLERAGSERSAIARWWIPPSLPSLAEELLRAGFDTAAFGDHPSLDETLGFARGFRLFRALREDEAEALGDGFEAAVAKFERWLGGHSRSQDWFAYVEAHDLVRLWTKREVDPRWSSLYEPRPELAVVPPTGAFSRGFHAVPHERWGRGPLTLGDYDLRYDGELTNLDAQIGRLLQRLHATGRLANTTVVVVGTHGTSFGEGGVYLDAGTLLDSDLHVPLIVRQPLLAQKQGRVHRAIVSTLDVAPTLLDLVGIVPPPTMHGVSLAPILRGSDEPRRAIAYASGGLLEGSSACDESACVGVDRPDLVLDRQVRESWLGARGAGNADSTPWTATRGAAAPDARREERLSRALQEWDRHIQSARMVLQGPGGDAPRALQSLVEPARAARLGEVAR